MDSSNQSSLSAGLILYDLLTGDESLSGVKVYPVTAKAGVQLPFISYKRVATDVNPLKQGHGAETVHVEVNCYAETYQDSVRLAENVREALDHAEAGYDGISMRSCTFENSSEGYEDDAFLQSLIFTIRI